MIVEPADREAAEQLSTFNFCGVTAKDERVIVLLHGQISQGTLDPEDAIRLAAWLIVGAELAGLARSPQLASALVERILKT